MIRPTFCCRAAAVLYLNSISDIWYFLAEYHKTVVEKRMDHLPSRPVCCKRYLTYFLTRYRAFSLTWPASMQIYWNKRKRLHEKRIQLPQDCLGTPTWPPFHSFGTPIWPPWRHVKTLCTDSALEYKLTLCSLVLWYFPTTKSGVLHIGISLSPPPPPLAGSQTT